MLRFKEWKIQNPNAVNYSEIVILQHIWNRNNKRDKSKFTVAFDGKTWHILDKSFHILSNYE